MLANFVTPDIFVHHLGQRQGRSPSPRLMAKIKGTILSPDGYGGAIFEGDDFTNFPAIAPAISGTTAGTALGYGYYVDTATSACSIKQGAGNNGGVLDFSIGATDNHECWLTSGGNTGVLSSISETANKKLTIFEARVKFGQVAAHNVFVGLGEEGLAAANTITDAGALADKDLLGFWSLEADSTILNFGYRKAGGAVQTKIASLQTITADTWYNLGFIYDPNEPPSERMKVYVDNVENATKITATSIAAATFPAGEELAFLIGGKTGAAAAKAFSCDWWYFFQAP